MVNVFNFGFEKLFLILIRYCDWMFDVVMITGGKYSKDF